MTHRSVGRRAICAAVLLGQLLVACSSTAATQPRATSATSSLPATLGPVTTAASTVTSPSAGATRSAAPATPGGSASAAPGSVAARSTILVADARAVASISRAVAAAAQSANPSLAVIFQPAQDFSAFCAGGIDAYGAARKIDAHTEAAACKNNKVAFVELKVALNGAAVVTTAADTGVGCLAVADLYALFGPESTGIHDWKDVNPIAAALGSGAAFDPLPLSVVGSPADAPSSLALIDKAIAPTAAQRSKTPALRSDVTPAADDAVLIASLAAVPAGGIGWTALGTALAHPDALRTVRIDGGDGCVAADAAHAQTGAYPLTQPLYLYVNAASGASKAGLAAFVDAYLSDTTQTTVITKLSYVPLSAAALDDARFAWQNR